MAPEMQDMMKESMKVRMKVSTKQSEGHHIQPGGFTVGRKPTDCAKPI